MKLNKQLQTLLLTISEHKTSQHVFTNPVGEKIGRSQLCRHILSFKAHFPNGKNWNCHAFRHSFAHNFLKEGSDHMYELQAVLGHKSIQLTIDLYGKIFSEDVIDASPIPF